MMRNFINDLLSSYKKKCLVHHCPLTLSHTYINDKINNISTYCSVSYQSQLSWSVIFRCFEYFFCLISMNKGLSLWTSVGELLQDLEKKKKSFLPFHTKARMQRWVSSNTGVVEACRMSLPAKCEQRTENTLFESRAAPLASRTVEAILLTVLFFCHQPAARTIWIFFFYPTRWPIITSFWWLIAIRSPIISHFFALKSL